MDEPAGRTNPDLHPLEAAHRERLALIRTVRLAFIVLFFTVALLTILRLEPGAGRGTEIVGGLPMVVGWELIVGIAFALAGIVTLIDLFTSRRRIGTLLAIFLGLLAALVATYALGKVIDLLIVIFDIDAPNLVSITKTLLGIALAYLCITTVLQTQDDFRLVIPYVEFAKQIRGPRPLILDTSALIDGRIGDLCLTGIIQHPVVVPRFVVAELQLLADSSDKLRRSKGRRGLDVITRLQRTPGLDLSIDETPVPGKAVDQMLIEMAKEMPAVIVTADVGLARVAVIQGVKVLNLNDVANALKPALIPGEQLSIKLLKQGEQPGQAVGYLDDGTMVVAENGAGLVGQQVTVILTSSLQTSAGRLLFGKVLDLGEPETPLPPPEDATAAPEDPPRSAAGAEADPAPRSPFPPHPPRRPNPARNPRR